MKRAIVVMGKLPRPGRVKTRLCPPLSLTQAAQLYEAFLQDVFSLVTQAADPSGAEMWFSCGLGEDDSLDEAKAIAPAGFQVVMQAPGDLGHRMRDARLRTHAEEVVIVGSDTPSMRPSRIVDAFAYLASQTSGVVVGPTEDGGYDLIGLKGEVNAIFSKIPWSTERVMAATRMAAQRARIDLTELDEKYDLDTIAELVRFGQDPDSQQAPRSLAIVQAVLSDLP